MSTIKLYAWISLAFCPPLPCRIHGHIPVFPNGRYCLHELFQIELDPQSLKIWFGISNVFTGGMTKGTKLVCNTLKGHVFQILADQLSFLITAVHENAHSASCLKMKNILDILSKSCENHSY